MTTTTRVATNARERWALLITSEHGEDLTSHDRQVGLRVCLASTGDGAAQGLELARIGLPMGMGNAEVRAALRRLWRQHWITGGLDGHSTAYDLELGIPWWTLESNSSAGNAVLPHISQVLRADFPAGGAADVLEASA